MPLLPPLTGEPKDDRICLVSARRLASPPRGRLAFDYEACHLLLVYDAIFASMSTTLSFHSLVCMYVLLFVCVLVFDVIVSFELSFGRWRVVGTVDWEREGPQYLPTKVALRKNFQQKPLVRTQHNR